MATALSTSERKALKEHETVIGQGLTAFVAVGNALAEINENRLYVEKFDTFEKYCKKRWELGKSRAYQLINSAKTVDTLSTIVDIKPPSNEGIARVVSELPNEQAQATVWTRATETAPKGKDGEPKITAAHVRAVAEEMIPTMTCEKPKPPKATPPVNEDSEPDPEVIAKPPKAGQPKVDVRKFDALEKKVGEVVRLNTALKDHCGGKFFHEEIRQHLNGILTTLKAWKKDAL